MFEDEKYSHKYLWLLLQSNTFKLTFKCFSFRPFTIPQVLRTGKQTQEDDEDDEEEAKVW